MGGEYELPTMKPLKKENQIGDHALPQLYRKAFQVDVKE
jgi:hypothetical protein